MKSVSKLYSALDCVLGHLLMVSWSNFGQLVTPGKV